MAKIGKALASGMGLMPAALSGAFGKENRGFGLGLMPGLIYRDQYDEEEKPEEATQMKKGGMAASKMGKVKTGKPKMGSASSRADGCAVRGKTKGRMV